MVLIKTHRDTLLAPLQSVSGIVERRHTLPILSNVLLEKKGDRLTLLATDIEIQITTATEGAGGDGDGAVTVGARKLQDILRRHAVLRLGDQLAEGLLRDRELPGFALADRHAWKIVRRQGLQAEAALAGAHLQTLVFQHQADFRVVRQ